MRFFSALSFAVASSRRTKTAIESFAEAFLLDANNLADALLFVLQFWISVAHDGRDRLRDFMEERLFQADQSAMACGAAQQAAQHVAASFVARRDAVGDQETDGAGMIVDDAKRNIRRRIDAIVLAGESFRGRGELAHDVDIVVRQHFLQHRGDALQTHAGIDMLGRQFG